MAKKTFYDEFVTALKAGCTYSLTQNLPDPDPILRKVGASYRMYREIRSDTKVNACIEQRKSGTLRLQWGLLPQGEDASEAALNAIEQALNALNIPRVLSDMLEAFVWGFQPLEVMWERRDGLILPRSVQGKPPEWFVFDYSNRLKFRSRTNPLGEELPERKFLLTQHNPDYMNPYGQKCLPMCFWPVTFKRGGLKWWVTLAEKWGQPLLLAKYPRGIEDSAKENLLDMLQSLYQDAVGIMPNDTQVETIDTGGHSDSGSVHKALIDQCNTEIALAILGQTLSSEVGAKGSYAAAQSHLNVLADIVDYDKRMCEEACQQLVNWIYELNWSAGMPPKFSLWKEQDVDKDLADRDHTLYSLGMRFSKNYFLRAYGLKEDDFEMAEEPQPGAEFAEAEGGKGSKKEAKSQVNEALGEVDHFLSVEQGAKIIRPCLDLLAECSNYEEVLGKLFKLFPKMDTSLLVEGLTRAMYLAELEGKQNAKPLKHR